MHSNIITPLDIQSLQTTFVRWRKTAEHAKSLISRLYQRNKSTKTFYFLSTFCSTAKLKTKQYHKMVCIEQGPWFVNNRVWIRVSLNEKFLAKVYRSWHCTFRLIILWKNDVTVFVCLNTVIQTVTMLLDFSITDWNQISIAVDINQFDGGHKSFTNVIKIHRLNSYWTEAVKHGHTSYFISQTMNCCSITGMYFSAEIASFQRTLFKLWWYFG